MLAPNPSDLTAPFWASGREGILRIPRCRSCRSWFFPPLPACPICLDQRIEWAAASGRGFVDSFTVVHRPADAAFNPPYVLAVVRLEEGPFITSNLIDIDEGTLRCDMAVVVRFSRVDDQIFIPYFTATDMVLADSIWADYL